MTSIGDWQGKTGQGWAAQWQRTDRSFGALTEKLLVRSRHFPFTHALDIGCGAGELSLALGRRHPQARVVGVDVSPQLVEIARERGANLANVSFELADAADWQPAIAPQLIVSRHGVMFFDDPRAAFANLYRVAHDEATMLFSCFRDRRENPFFTEIDSLLPPPAEPPDPHAPGPFAFADPEHVAALLEGGGWRQPKFEAFDFAMIAGAGDDPVEDAMTYFKTIGPAAAALRDLPEDRRASLIEEMRRVVRANCSEGLVAMRAAVWIVTASKA